MLFVAPRTPPAGCLSLRLRNIDAGAEGPPIDRSITRHTPHQLDKRAGATHHHTLSKSHLIRQHHQGCTGRQQRPNARGTWPRAVAPPDTGVTEGRRGPGKSFVGWPFGAGESLLWVVGQQRSVLNDRPGEQVSGHSYIRAGAFKPTKAVGGGKYRVQYREVHFSSMHRSIIGCWRGPPASRARLLAGAERREGVFAVANGLQ